MERLNWSSVVRSIGKSRSAKARFFKPVCVIAALDLADEGLINPDDIDAQSVVDRFSDYITPFFHDRGGDGYQPLWHLSNNQLWTFFNGARPLTSKEFSDGNPRTKKQLFGRFDKLAIRREVRKLWDSPQERHQLRNAMLLMLFEGDYDSRSLVPPLFNPKYLLEDGRWPTQETLDAYFSGLTNQLSLFDLQPELPVAERTASAAQSAEMPTLSVGNRTLPFAAIENVPSAVDYLWSNGRIVVGPNQASIPAFPFATSKRDHQQRLEACAVLADDLLRELDRQRWQVREEYRHQVRRYVERLPKGTDSDSILLSDAAARTLRELFGAEQSFLPAPFAAALKVLLQHHIALRPFYPALGDFYRAVQTGRIEEPLPLDAVESVKAIVLEQTPDVFDVSVSIAIGETSAPEATIVAIEIEGPNDEETISPPPDPIGELDQAKAHDFQIAGVLNGLWKVLSTAEKVRSTTEAWIQTYQSMSGPMKQILEWLQHALNRSGAP